MVALLSIKSSAASIKLGRHCCFAGAPLLTIAEENKTTDEATIQTYLNDAVKKIDQEFAKYKKG